MTGHELSGGLLADLTPPADLPSRHAWRAAQAVTCPKCGVRPGNPCQSTGGGNRATVATHAARRARVQGWDEGFAAEAGWLVGRYQYRTVGTWPAGMFDRFESAANPTPVKAVKQPTPKGVRLSEAQAEEIERYVLRGGYGTVSTAHFHGDAAHRQTVNALEAKGIVEATGERDHYGRSMKLTEFGWRVYYQHRLIIRRLTDKQVVEQVARAEEGRCIECGMQPGETEACDLCGLERFTIADKAMRDFNDAHPVGTKVRYWVGPREGVGNVSITTDRAICPVASGPAVRIAGEADLVPLSAVEPVLAVAR